MNLKLKSVINQTIVLIVICFYFEFSNCFILNALQNSPTKDNVIPFGQDPQSPIIQITMNLLRLAHRKPYSGMRATEDSVLKVSWYLYTVLVVEEDSSGNILSCEFVDTVEDSYKNTLLEQLSSDAEPQELDLEEMLDIMYSCQKVKSPLTKNQKSRIFNENLDKIEFLSLLRAIVPGTRWCGVNDIAFNFHDLGFRKIDKCCRTHDYCPESVLPFQVTFNLTNPGPFTRSHCLCEDYLKKCLMDVGNEDSKAMGNVYFNLLKIPCIEDREEGKVFRDATVFPILEEDNNASNSTESMQDSMEE